MALVQMNQDDELQIVRREVKTTSKGEVETIKRINISYFDLFAKFLVEEKSPVQRKKATLEGRINRTVAIYSRALYKGVWGTGAPADPQATLRALGDTILDAKTRGIRLSPKATDALQKLVYAFVDPSFNAEINRLVDLTARI